MRGGFSFIFLVFRLWSLSWNCTGCVICCNFLPPQIGLFFCGIAMGAANVNVFVNLLATFVTQENYDRSFYFLPKNYEALAHLLSSLWKKFLEEQFLQKLYFLFLEILNKKKENMELVPSALRGSIPRKRKYNFWRNDSFKDFFQSDDNKRPILSFKGI